MTPASDAGPGNDKPAPKEGVRPRRLRRLAQLTQATRYLEVGVASGSTFFASTVESKVAVDPKFRFDAAAHESADSRFFEVTSDEFFTGQDEKPFDLIYLDGLHTFEQTLRDFLVSLRMAHGRTVWLIDDTVPNDAFSILTDQQRCYRLRRSAGNSDTRWMGDTFKLVYFVRDFMPQFSFATYRGHGQTVIWQEVRAPFEPMFDSVAKIAALDFPDFLETKDQALNFHADAEIERLISSALRR